MTTLVRRRLLHAAALIPALGAFAASAAAAGAAQAVDTTVRAACTATGGTGIPEEPATTIDVHVTGSLPASAAPGATFTLDQLTTEFIVDPNQIRPQVVLTDGTYSARLNSLELAGTGTTQSSATVVDPSAPLDLGTHPHRVDIAPRFLAPPEAPKTTFAPAGPWTIAAGAKAADISLGSFGLTFTFVDPTRPTFAPVTTTVACKPAANTLGTVTAASTTVRRPWVTNVSPRIGRGGSTVSIGGVNLAGATQVTFGGSPAKFSVLSANRIIAVVPTLYFVAVPPPVIRRDVAVTTPGGTSADTSADDFYYLTGGVPLPTPTS